MTLFFTSRRFLRPEAIRQPRPFFVSWCEEGKMCLFIYLAFIRTIDRRGWNWCWMERRADRKEQCPGRPYLDIAGCCDGKWNVRRGRGSRCVCNTQTQVHIWESANQHMARLVRLMMPSSSLHSDLNMFFYLLRSSCFFCLCKRAKSVLDTLKKAWYCMKITAMECWRSTEYQRKLVWGDGGLELSLNIQ